MENFLLRLLLISPCCFEAYSICYLLHLQLPVVVQSSLLYHESLEKRVFANKLQAILHFSAYHDDCDNNNSSPQTNEFLPKKFD